MEKYKGNAFNCQDCDVISYKPEEVIEIDMGTGELVPHIIDRPSFRPKYAVGQVVLWSHLNGSSGYQHGKGSIIEVDCPQYLVTIDNDVMTWFREADLKVCSNA